MGNGNILVGLEIGTTKVCVVVGETLPNGGLRTLGVGLVPSRGVRKGEIVDFDMAHQCVREAFAEAEERGDVEIRSVFISITGAHVGSFNNRGIVTLPEDREEIDDQDCDEVADNARDAALPQPNSILHAVLQRYYVDGQEGVLNPVGMLGHQLEADFHIIHGVANRIKNAIRCVKELNVEVDDVAFAGLASAQATLTPEQRDLGALVIDIGGGVTDYLLYQEGAVTASGVLAVGGDHINNDISMGLRIPIAKAEKLKVQEGSVLVGSAPPGDRIILKDETGFAGREIERETLNLIIHARMAELFELIKRRIGGDANLPMLGAGVFLTGGSSQLRGLGQLAAEAFHQPVHVARAQSLSGALAAAENPQFATAVGLLRYGQAHLPERPRSKIFNMFRSLFGH